jgi:hypothetical protein
MIKTMRFKPSAGLALNRIEPRPGILWIGIFPGFLYNLAVNSVKIFPGL